MVRYDKSAADAGSKYVRKRGSGIPGGGKAVIGGGGSVLMLILALIFGGDVLGSDNAVNTQSGAAVNSPRSTIADDDPCDDGKTEELMCFLMNDLNTTWEKKFAEYDETYEPTYLNIFTGGVTTNGCGSASSASGPFYCPAPQDKEVYIDLGFYDQLATEYDAPGDFAQAYVIAHEVGHHISNISGDAETIRTNQQQDSQRSNQYQVLLELQADCYAGIWANSASQRRTREGFTIIEPDDISEGLEAAAAVGDDRIQKRMTGQVNPHNWTHGSAAQRQTAFVTGFKSGEIGSCALEQMDRVTQVS